MEEELDLLDILLDKDCKEPIVLKNPNGNQLSFEQVAVIPYEYNKELKFYCILKPLAEIPGLADDEAIVFSVESDDDCNSVLKVEENEEIVVEIFDRYYQMLDESMNNKKNKK